MNARPTAPMDNSTELALVDRCRQHDGEAFGRIIDAYHGRLYGFVRRMVRDAEDAADVTQEAFVKAFQAIGRFDGRSSFRTWLFRIAYNLCIDRARKEGRSPNEVHMNSVHEDEVMDIPDERWDPEQMVITEELQQVLEQGIISMSEKLRSVLLLHDKEDLAYDEIAKVLNIPVGTVKSRLFLARAHLQNLLAPYVRADAMVEQGS